MAAREDTARVVGAISSGAISSGATDLQYAVSSLPSLVIAVEYVSAANEVQFSGSSGGSLKVRVSSTPITVGHTSLAI